jgi:hypothetical protein
MRHFMKTLFKLSLVLLIPLNLFGQKIRSKNNELSFFDQTEFRKEYKKELKYHYSDKNYSKSGLDEVYLCAEYYIANSKNELIKLAIQNKDQLEYSIESRTENNRYYEVLGIGYTFEHRFNIMQWIYIDIETYKIYEYDLASEKLIEFK